MDREKFHFSSCCYLEPQFTPPPLHPLSLTVLIFMHPLNLLLLLVHPSTLLHDY